MAKVERKATELQIETYRDFIAQNEKHIADWEKVAKVFEEDFNTKLEYGCSLNSLTVAAKRIANAFEAIEDEKNRIDGYVAEIAKLSAKLEEDDEDSAVDATNGKNYFATYKTATTNFQKVEADFQVSNEPEEIASDAENGDAVEIAEFEVGKTYYAHSSCDYGTVFEYKVN